MKHWLKYLIVIIIFVGGVLLFIFIHPKSSFIPLSSIKDTASTRAETVTPEQSLEYQSEKYHFKLNYPSNLKIKEYVETNGNHTVSFESLPGTNEEGFEIYIVNYNENKVTTERFNLDEPSGIMGEPKNVLVDGVKGSMYFGKNSVMGDTREVWFINKGFLYEVTTYKVLDEWLQGIMQTWKFI
ncbi:hypothetical protein H0W91_00590 [Patescibacteria group bacterium]|nr:hypothetical protein [Patescibacteria group bacterium]